MKQIIRERRIKDGRYHEGYEMLTKDIVEAVKSHKPVKDGFWHIELEDLVFMTFKPNEPDSRVGVPIDTVVHDSNTGVTLLIPQKGSAYHLDDENFCVESLYVLLEILEENV